MPYFFQFKINNKIRFHCFLDTYQCEAHNKNGQRCRRKVCIHFEYCTQHLRSIRHLDVRKSYLPQAGSGLFAYSSKNGSDDDLVFEKGETICGYNGEIIDENEKYYRYKNKTAPYAVQMNKKDIIDCAQERSIGSLANTLKGNTNARLVVNNQAKTVKLVATKNIYHNQEIYLPYGASYKLHENGVDFSTSYITPKKEQWLIEHQGEMEFDND